MSSAERITDIEAVHGEGPCWDPGSGRMLWVDMFAGSFLATDLDSGETERIEVEGPVAACLRPSADGSGIVVAGEQNLQLVGGSGAQILASVPLEEGVRFNDGACDPQGRMYVGSLAYDLSLGAGDVWRVSASEPAVVISDTTQSNGIGWSPDGTIAYFVDSETNRIERFDFDPVEGTFNDGRPFAEIEDGDGIPDGLCVDVEGGIWVALWGTGTVRRYEPSGAISANITVDCPPVTACSFGGPEMDTLVMTTSRYEDPHREPPAGSLFGCNPGVAGLPVQRVDVDQVVGS